VTPTHPETPHHHERPDGPADSTRTPLDELLAGLRMPDTSAPRFDPAHAPDDPWDLLADWIRTAIEGGVAAPHAMTLATRATTLSNNREPEGVDARTVLLRALEVDGDAPRFLAFASSADSPKGRQLAAHSAAALVLHWREQHRQIRITGSVQPAPREDSDADFLARPAPARAAIIAARQSEPLPDAEDAAQSHAAAAELLAVNPLFVPPSWTLYRMSPHRIEFWQGQPRTPQQRLLYTVDADGAWSSDRLWP
jgi:pyridoxamine 5'-phosphate oxidase